MSHRLSSLCVGLVALASPASLSGAATIAQYTFEENPAGTSTTAINTVLVDSSGNGLDLTKNAPTGTVAWDADVAPVQPAASTSLFFNAAGSLETPVGDWSFAANPQFTIEFWYKPDLVDTLRWLVDTGEGANAWSLYQELPGSAGAPAGRSNLEFAYLDNAGVVRGINTATTFAADSPWTHVALSVDIVSGDVAIYFNGVEDASTAGVDENLDSLTFGNKAGTLRIGQLNPSGSFSNRAYFDDLRLSDEVLLPGEGSGVGELAWNATLVPEPGVLSLVAVGLGVIGLRRR